MSDRKLIERLYKGLGSFINPEQTSESKATGTVLKAVNEEQRKCTEIVYKPDVKDAHGEWMSAETIAKAEKSFRNNDVVANLFHVTETDKFTVERSWVLAEDATFEGRDEVVTKGTWLVDTFYEDEALWELKKEKKLGGLSMGAYGQTTKDGELINVCFSKEEFEALQEGNE